MRNKLIKIFNFALIIVTLFFLASCQKVNNDLLISSFSYNEEQQLVVTFKSDRNLILKQLDEIEDLYANSKNELVVKYPNKEEEVIGNLPNKYLVKYLDSNGLIIDVLLASKNKKLDKPTDPTKDNFEFIDWYVEGEPYAHNKAVKSHLSIVAHWRSTHEVPGDIILDITTVPSEVDNIISVEMTNHLFQYSKVQSSTSGHINLEHTGLITNTVSIDKIKGIKVKFQTKTNDAKLNLYYGNHALPIYNQKVLVSDSYIEFNEMPSYFVIQALDKPFTPNDFYDSDHDNKFELKVPAQAVVEIESIEIYLENETSEVVNDTVPKLYVDLALDSNGKPLPIKNKEDYVDSMVRLVDPLNSENDLGGEEGLVAGIRLRGNSTRSLPKRPYRLKFDKKQSLFGLTKAKDWALLADYMDGSSLHNFSALTMAQNLDSFNYAPSSIFIELYLNGVYQGIYLLTEHQEAKEGRIPVEQDITAELANEDISFYIEQDRSTIYYPDVEIEGIDYFTIVIDPNDKYGTLYFSLKYPAKKDFEKALGKSSETDQRFDSFFQYVKGYMEDIIALFNQSGNNEVFASKIDVNSLVDFIMIDFITLETDHKFQSMKMHYIAEDEKLYFGPIWDYDSMVMGLPFEKIGVDYPFDKANDPKYALPYKRKSFYNHMFSKYITNHNGMAHLKQRYQEVGSQLITDVLNHIQTDVMPHIANNLIEDANLWYEGNLSMVFENLRYLDTYMRNRKAFLDTYLK